MKLLSIFASILLLASTAYSQEVGYVPPFQAGMRAGYLMNFHHTDANIFTGCAECGQFGNGKGSGYNLEAFGEVPFNFFRKLSLTFGVGLAERGGAFGEAVTGLLPILDPNTNKYVTLTRQNSYTASLKYLTVSGGLRIQPLLALPIYAGASLEGGMPLGKATTYTQSESILQPQGVVYPETNTTSRTVGSGVIQNLHTAFGLAGMLGYEVPISVNLTAAPEIAYYFPLTDVEPNFKWRVASLRAGVAVRWHAMPPFEPVHIPDPPVVERDNSSSTLPRLSAVSLSAEPYRILETTVTETFPILPYVFFDSANSILPSRFSQLSKEDAEKFSEANLPHRSLESYYNMLNVIGKRLQSNPTATLSISGTTDGRELALSEARSTLAGARAAQVKAYLVDVWHIAPVRLVVRTSEAPLNPSSTEYPQGFEENRRVELSSNEDQILKPIVHERFREETATPKTLPFKIAATGKYPIRDWQVAIRSHGNIVYQTAGTGTPPTSLNWLPNDAQIETLAKSLQPNDSLFFELQATAVNGATATRITGVPANKAINPYELSRLSLIVFDFDQANISGQNKRMISQFVGKSFYPVSTATITGSTDNLGELAHNQKLSTDRANNVRDLIIAEKPESKITSTKGIGPANLLYDNNLPEGRYYCRTVKVEVETPLDAVTHAP